MFPRTSGVGLGAFPGLADERLPDCVGVGVISVNTGAAKTGLPLGVGLKMGVGIGVYTGVGEGLSVGVGLGVGRIKVERLTSGVLFELI
ncbi:MAG: hypothetical protein IV090_08805 [Candidatus Sericytochromatia bacterium]|nr:hypothetical protein [Candidatus Sericytochromatia bacterium]